MLQCLQSGNGYTLSKQIHKGNINNNGPKMLQCYKGKGEIQHGTLPKQCSVQTDANQYILGGYVVDINKHLDVVLPWWYLDIPDIGY